MYMHHSRNHSLLSLTHPESHGPQLTIAIHPKIVGIAVYSHQTKRYSPVNSHQCGKPPMKFPPPFVEYERVSRWIFHIFLVSGNPNGVSTHSHFWIMIQHRSPKAPLLAGGNL